LRNSFAGAYVINAKGRYLMRLKIREGKTSMGIKIPNIIMHLKYIQKKAVLSSKNIALKAMNVCRKK